MNDQPQPKRPILKDIVPVLTTSRLQDSIDFFCGILGFELGWTWGEPPNIASVCLDLVEINLAVHESDRKHSSNVYIVVEEIDLLYEMWKARGLKIETEIADQSYGMRDFAFTDPDGNRICVGEATTG